MSMTAEERACGASDSCTERHDKGSLCIRCATAAIRAAVEEEREGCLALKPDTLNAADPCDPEEVEYVVGYQTGCLKWEKAIRARGGAEEETDAK